jgi:hypothetical protein
MINVVNSNKSIKSHQSGVVLVMVIVLTVILAIIAAAILGFGLWAYEQATFYEDYNQALYSAEAGISFAIASNQSSQWEGPFSSPSTGSISNASFSVVSGKTNGDIIEVISTATVERLTSRSRSISVEVIFRDPWKHFIWQGCTTEPNGYTGDQVEYIDPYNSTTNGPQYGSDSGIGILDLRVPEPSWPDDELKWHPYFSKITSKTVQWALYLGKDTTIINYYTVALGVQQYSTTAFVSGDISDALPSAIKTAAGLDELNMIAVNDSTYTLFGGYTGMIYVQGTLLVDDPGNEALSVYGQVYAVGGNIEIGHNDKLTVHQVTTQSPVSLIVPSYDVEGTSYQQYITIAAIDTVASHLCDDSTDSGMGNLLQLTGNAALQMGNTGYNNAGNPDGTPIYYGGVMFVSNTDFKNGQGTEINGVVMMVDNSINGFASGNYSFDPTVQTDAPILGVDITHLQGRNVKAGTWRELPLNWSL